jgi:Zn-finger nucleic acid-binding protein
MQCPIDGETLLMTERSGVEIDYCPRCRGIWLDRGELDRIIEVAERLSPVSGAASHARTGTARDDRKSSHTGSRRDDDEDRSRKGKYKKRKEFDPYGSRRKGQLHFIKELFDF